MRCPICSTENEENAVECLACGYLFVATKETEEDSWVMEAVSTEDTSGMDGYGNAEGTSRNIHAEELPPAEPTDDQEPQQRSYEEGAPVSVITVTVPQVEQTTANTAYELQTAELFDTLPEEGEKEPEAPTKERFVRAVKAPITARETGLLIAVTILAIALLAVLGYFLVSGKLADSLHNFTDKEETTTAATIEETESQPETTSTPTETETAESTEESTEETTEETTEEAPLGVEVEDGVILYDNSVLLRETDTGYEVTAYMGDTIAVIPGEYDGKPVTTIADNAFSGCSHVTQIEVGEGVTTIGSNAFYGCSSLQVLALPDSLTGIGDHAFDYAGAFMVISHANTYAYQYCMALGIPWAEGAGLLPDGSVPENPQVPGVEVPAETQPVESSQETPAAPEQATQQETLPAETNIPTENAPANAGDASQETVAPPAVEQDVPEGQVQP